MNTIGRVEQNSAFEQVFVIFAGVKLGQNVSACLQDAGFSCKSVSVDQYTALSDTAYAMVLADQAAAEILANSKSAVSNAWYIGRLEAKATPDPGLAERGWHLLCRHHSDEQVLASLSVFLNGIKAGQLLDRQRAELHNSSYEALVQALPDIVYELDTDDCFTFVNEAVSMLGYKPEELIGQHYSVLLSEEDFHSVDREEVLKDFTGHKTGQRLSPKLFNERRSGGRRTANLELRLRNRFSTSEASLDLLGEIISYGEVSAAGAANDKHSRTVSGTVGIIRDITLRRKAEEMIRKLYHAVDQLKVSVFIVNHAFEIEYVNPCYFQFTGFTPLDMIGKDLFEFFSFLPARVKALQKIVQDGFEVKEAVEMHRHDSSGLWVEFRLSPVRSPDGIVTHAIAIADDISQQRQIEELLATARKQAGAASAAKSKFLSAMTHELKNPVSSILTAAELMRNSTDDVERRSTIIIENAHALTNLLSGILDYVRSEGDTSTYSLSQVPLKAYFENLCQPYEQKANSKGLDFYLKLLASGSVLIEPERLSKVIQILLDNALKFTETGSVLVDARIEHQTGNLPYLTVRVQDTGTGISQMDQETLFVPFSHNNLGARPFPRGAGVGLALARNLVRAMGGELRHEPNYTDGACFSLMLPIGAPVPVEKKTSAMVYNILLVDDNEINLEYMRTLMENAGFVIHTAISALEALQILDNHIIDAAIFDIYMPGYSGKELVQTIRNYTGYRFSSDMPVYAMSAFDSPEIFNPGETGSLFDGAFPKPVEINKLRDAIYEAAELKPDPAMQSLLSAKDLGPMCENSLETCQVLINLLEKSEASIRRINIQAEVSRLSKNLEMLGCRRGIALLELFLEHYAHEDGTVLNGIIQRVERVFRLALSRNG